MSSRLRVKRAVRRLWRLGVLLAVLIGAFALRVYDINWDQSRNLHPDERYIAVLAGLIHPPSTIGEYFDAARSPLNPFNTDWGRNYVYGTFPLFLGRYLGEWFDSACAQPPAPVQRVLADVVFGEYAAACLPGHFTGYTMLTLVGRLMSALADTLAVLVVFAIGAQAFGWRTGLLAAALSAFTVLNIQQAHFFTVDAMANLFVALTAWFSVRIAGHRPNTTSAKWSLLINAGLAGISVGLGLASKISTWPSVLLVFLALGIAAMRSRQAPGLLVSSVGAGVSVAAVFVAFRVAQPYAFIGASEAELQQTQLLCSPEANTLLTRVCAFGVHLPEPLRILFAPSGRWVQQLYLAQALVNGTVDAPFGIQWADRLPIVFPLVNLVFWGMGIPLGIAALIAVGDAARQLWSGRRWWAYLPLVAWAVGYFLYQGTQWTKSIRYLLPIYPVLTVLAAQALVRFWRSFPNFQAPLLARFMRFAAATPAALVLLGTIVWARAFMHIYDGEITRVQASRWVYENVPTAVTLLWERDEQQHQIQLPVREVLLEGVGASSTFAIRLSHPAHRLETPITSPRLRFNYLQGSALVQAWLVDMLDGNEVGRAQSTLNATQPVLTFSEALLQPGRDYWVQLRLLAGETLSARTSVVANEHWDDAVPQPLDGRNPYGDYYRGLSTSSDGQMQNYNDDTPEKLTQMLAWLDEADYLVLSSNRLYASIPRLPWRYPMTVRYYRALMGGELGFDLVADFHSFPRLGPFVFNDQEMPQVLVRPSGVQGSALGIEVPYPTAEEAFSVYDHPRVLIFRKGPRYSRANAERILGAADFSLFMRRSPLESRDAPHGLLLDDKTQHAQRTGGTWRALFSPEFLVNRAPFFAILAWLALTQLLGIAGAMLLFPILSAQSRSHAQLIASYLGGKTLGWLVPAWLIWMLASLRIMPFTPAAIWLVVGGFIALGLTVGHLHRSAILTAVRTYWQALLAAEVLYLVAFFFFLIIRWGNPDLWHPYMGGEKPMDFAYFNAVLKSTWFPPYDPWFSGGYLNYYYFGWVMVGTPVKALGIQPAVAYNLIIPSLFALTATGAFAAGATALAAMVRPHLVRDWRTLVFAGFISAALAVFLGNGDEIRVLSDAWKRLGGIERGVPEALALVEGFWRWINGAPLPIYPNWPYWNPTRPAPEVWIAEFPLFTFLYADLHAHMMAMPLVYLAILLALGLALGWGGGAMFALSALVVGVLWMTNSWDYPTLLLLTLAALWLRQWHNHQALDVRAALSGALRALPAMAVFVLLTRAVVLPYLAHFGSAYNAVDRWDGDRTQLQTFLTIYGLFMIPLAFFGARLLLRPAQAWAKGLVGGSIIVALMLAQFARLPVAFFAVPMFVLAVVLFLNAREGGARLVWLMGAGAWLLTLFVELFVLRGDIARMNTVFKLYIQAWLLLAVVSGAVAAWLSLAWLRRRMVAPLLRFSFAGAFAVAVGLAALYPLVAIPAKVNDRYTHEAPRGLDGAAFMRYAERVEVVGEDVFRFPLRHDYEAIQWLLTNVEGSPVILEGTTGGDLYRWGNRYSIYTGLPTVIGWQWHQRQQRAALRNDRVIYRRDDDVALFYASPDIDVARLLLERYHPTYVIVGPLERAYYGEAGLAKFMRLVEAGDLRVVYRNEGVTIYRTRYEP